MTHDRAEYDYAPPPQANWRVLAGVIVFLFLLVAGVPAILRVSLGFAGYLNYLLLVLPPGLLIGFLVGERVLPRMVNAFAVRVASGRMSIDMMHTASRVAWLTDIVVRATLAVAVILAIAFMDIPATVARIGVVVITITTFFGVLNAFIGARLAEEIDLGGAHLIRQVALSELQDSAVEGIRPRNWLHALIQIGLDPRDGSVWELQGLLFLYYHHLDAGRYSEARDAIKRAANLVQPTHAPLTSEVWYEAAFVAARLDANPEAARGCMRFLRRSKGDTQAHTRHRVEAAILLAEGHAEAAEAEARRGLEAVHGSTARAIARMDRELLVQILRESEG